MLRFLSRQLLLPAESHNRPKVRTVLFFSDKILIESLPTVLGMVNGPTASALPDGSEADTDLQRLIDLGHQVFT